MLRAGLLWLLAPLRIHPVRTCVAALFGIMLTGIVLNAVLFQKGHHPAPLFGPAHRDRQAQLPTASIPLPRPRPSKEASAPVRTPSPRPGGEADGAPLAPPATSVGSAQSHKRDGISQLLHEDNKLQAEARSAKAALTDVMAAQRALRKLGYEVTANGHMGPATRQALESFRRDHHLPADHELTPKLLHDLAEASAAPRG